MTETTAPIDLDCELACAADNAFATYVDRIGEWWDPRYTANEPGPGGRVYASHSGL